MIYFSGEYLISSFLIALRRIVMMENLRGESLYPGLDLTCNLMIIAGIHKVRPIDTAG